MMNGECGMLNEKQATAFAVHPSPFIIQHSTFSIKEQPMPGIIGRKARKNKASRRKNPSQTVPLRTTPIAVTNVSVLAAVLTVTFDQAVVLTGTPAYTTD